MISESDNTKRKAKVFCIGFHKTGTTSLAVALQKLGYRVTGPNGVYDPAIARNAWPMALSLVERYDAFRDNPWPVLYKGLDERFPGSRFILTERDPESWIRSQVRHFGRKTSPMRQWIYGAGCPEGNEQRYRHRYEQHIREVKEYFSDRPADLLVMDLSAGDGWDELCRFLGVAVPDRPFPRANEAADRESGFRWKAGLARMGKRLYYRLRGLGKS